MKPYSPSTDSLTVRTEAKAARARSIAADHGAARKVRNWCTHPYRTRGASICIAPAVEEREWKDSEAA